MFNLFIIFFLIIYCLGIRTFLWHLQNWQIREYRFDRVSEYFKTKEGLKNFFNVWFFKGFLPRPQKTSRIFIIIGIFLLLQLLLIKTSFDKGFFKNINFLTLIGFLVLWERTIFILTAFSVFISKAPVFLAQKILFKKAKKIIEKGNSQVIRIGISGSFGKSSTKEILVHLLQQNFGSKNILFNPENQNNEVAIARLILKNKVFFKTSKKEKTKIFICEIGAYKKGEIKKVCDFFIPHIGIMTGLNDQHISLFGSQKNIQKAKFELAESVTQKIFFNADNQLLNEIFEDRKIQALSIPISTKSIEIKEFFNKSEFKFYNEEFVLPWAGKFFVQNAILALECARELGIKREKLPNLLKTIPPLKRALLVEKFQKTNLLKDLYSANPDGIKMAINHLKNFKGKKIFIGLPLLELGTKSKKNHQEIFKLLKNIEAEVFWLKSDFVPFGKEICGKKFHFHKNLNTTIKQIENLLKNLSERDAILLESKLPESILNIFKK